MTAAVSIVEARFVAGAATAASLPPATVPEIAFAGRSNVGKSSLLQALLGRKGLVRISSTPGRTRQINLFDVVLAGGRHLQLADLPGYGWARVSRAERRRWGPLVEVYLERRPTLRAVVVILDARRGADDDDLDLADYLRAIGRPIVSVVTKIDKLPKHRVKPVLQEIGESLRVRPHRFSAVTGEGREEIWAALLEASGGA